MQVFNPGTSDVSQVAPVPLTTLHTRYSMQTAAAKFWVENLSPHNISKHLGMKRVSGRLQLLVCSSEGR